VHAGFLCETAYSAASVLVHFLLLQVESAHCATDLLINFPLLFAFSKFWILRLINFSGVQILEPVGGTLEFRHSQVGFVQATSHLLVIFKCRLTQLGPIIIVSPADLLVASKCAEAILTVQNYIFFRGNSACRHIMSFFSKLGFLSIKT
jgi:hypothetical protein